MISPELFSKWLFWDTLGRKLDLNNPTGLNAKIMWLKLNDYKDNPLVTKCSDKYKVREYITECGYQHILNELYEVWERVEDVKWESLPSSFVLKCNHGCGYNWICRDKNCADQKDAFEKLNQWMNEEYWLYFGEVQYRDIKKYILCEKYLGDDILDYKIYCFNGKPMYILTCVGRTDGLPSHMAIPGQEEPKFFFFDRDWKMCPLTNDSLHYANEINIPRPKNFEMMLEIAEKLCEPFPFVRVDLYNKNGEIIFGELTFTPSAALDTGRLLETDQLFGEMLNLESYQ